MPTYAIINGARIEIRSRESGHNIPHVHAVKNGQSISIAFNGCILAGRLKSKKDEESVVQWVIDNKSFLEDRWKEMH